MNNHIITLTMGDAAGIGPELALKAACDASLLELTNIAVVGNARVLRTHARMMNLPFDIPIIKPDAITPGAIKGAALVDVEIPQGDDVKLGSPSDIGGRLSIECVETALRLVQSKCADAIVTGPINKESVGLAGYPWAGHTDFLKERTNTEQVVMMLAGGGLRVGLVTHHIPVADIPARIDSEKILAALRIMDAHLKRYFGLRSPRIAVAALNPHASDGGRFGDEETRVIIPAIERASAEGIDCTGPHAADTMFVPDMRESYDAVLAMYHDQGLIPLKMLAFGRAVNITLGLPIIRTSVDHGTAYDIAGQGIARTESMEEAIRLAVEIVERLQT